MQWQEQYWCNRSLLGWCGHSDKRAVSGFTCFSCGLPWGENVISLLFRLPWFWVISCWERGSFGISLVYQHLHVLIEFLLVFNLPFPPYHCKWEFGESRGVGLGGLKTLQTAFWTRCAIFRLWIPDPTHTVAGRCFLSPRTRERGFCEDTGVPPSVSALPCCTCQRGSSPDFVIRTHSIYPIPVFTCIVCLIATASSLSKFHGIIE